MEDCRHRPHRDCKTDPHIDIANLRHRGKSDQPPHIVLVDRHHRPDNHTRHTEYKQEIGYLVVEDKIESKNPVKNLEKQENISLRYKT